MKQREPGRVRTMPGIVAGAAFSMRVLRRHINLYQFLVVGVAAFITSVVGRTSAKTLAG